MQYIQYSVSLHLVAPTLGPIISCARVSGEPDLIHLIKRMALNREYQA